MNSKIFGIPVIVIVLGFMVSAFASLPSLYFYLQLRSDISTLNKTVVIKVYPSPSMANIEASKSASSSAVRFK